MPVSTQKKLNAHTKNIFVCKIPLLEHAYSANRLNSHKAKRARDVRVSCKKIIYVV